MDNTSGYRQSVGGEQFCPVWRYCSEIRLFGHENIQLLAMSPVDILWFQLNCHRWANLLGCDCVLHQRVENDCLYRIGMFLCLIIIMLIVLNKWILIKFSILNSLLRNRAGTVMRTWTTSFHESLNSPSPTPSPASTPALVPIQPM